MQDLKQFPGLPGLQGPEGLQVLQELQERQDLPGMQMECQLQGGGVPKRTEITYLLAPNHFSESELALFKASEDAYGEINIKVRQTKKNPDVIVHLSTDNDIRKLYPELGKYPGLSLTDRGKSPMHIHLHLENWLQIPKHLGSEFTKLKDYRIALISHEFAHVLGHDHVSCAAKGELADIRQQPSRSLGGCLPTTKIIFNSKSPKSNVNF